MEPYDLFWKDLHFGLGKIIYNLSNEQIAERRTRFGARIRSRYMQIRCASLEWKRTGRVKPLGFTRKVTLNIANSTDQAHDRIIWRYI